MKPSPFTSKLVALVVCTLAMLLTPQFALAQDPSLTLYLPLIVKTTHNDTTNCVLNEQEEQLAELIRNAAGQGRSSFTCDPMLAEVANAHAKDMASRRYLSSTNPDGFGPNYRVRQAGYLLPDYYNASATGNNIESIAAGYRTADKVWELVANHPQILGSDEFYAAQTHFGIAHFEDPISPYRHYWVIITAPPSA